MKKLFLLHCLLIIFTFNNLHGQVGQWVWLHGDSTFNNVGNFGIKGVSSPSNIPPSLYEPCEWTDLNGNFWMYGGNDSSITNKTKNDLWKYNPTLNEWTWMTGTNSVNAPGIYGTQGMSSPSNHPPAKGFGVATWVDLNSNLWMFGGYNGVGYNNDLWKYDIITNEWTWMKGSNTTNLPGIYGTKGIANISNRPDARAETAATWTDSAGDLWFFGGARGNISFNDLWKYNIASNSWTWMKGSNFTNQSGVYGTIGIEDSLNTPSARGCFSHWKDSIGNFWIFGGIGFNPGTFFNDLWRYNLSTNNWTWMSGSNVGFDPGYYGSKCIMTLLNIPTYRFENRAVWTDTNGNFWMFGGGLGSGGVLNDLWKYSIADNQWIWISGDSTGNPIGEWGIKGIANPTNQPKGRAGATGWIAQNNDFYLFGGAGTTGKHNDLWKYTIDTLCASGNPSNLPPTAKFTFSDSTICAGLCINFINSSQNSNSYQWFFPGGYPASDTSQNPQQVCYLDSGVFDVTLIASNLIGSDTITYSNSVTVYPQVTFYPLTQNYDSIISTPGYATYVWYKDSVLIAGASDYFYIATQNGDYSVVVIDSNGCSASAYLLNVKVSIDDIPIFANDFTARFDAGNLYLNINIFFTSPSFIQLTDVYGKEIFRKDVLLKNGENEISLSVENLSTGIYFVKVLNTFEALTCKIFIR